MIDIKLTEKRPEHAENEFSARRFSLPDNREARMQYEVDGVGVEIIGKPNILAGKMELIVSRFSKSRPTGKVEHSAFVNLNQIIRVEVDSSDPSNIGVMEGEIARFCTDKLSSYFKNNDTEFDYVAMSESLVADPDASFISCAELDHSLKQSIYRKAMNAKVPFLASNQRELALEPNISGGASRRKSASKRAMVDLGALSEASSSTNLNNTISNRVTASRSEKDGVVNYSFVQPTPEGRKGATDPFEVVINVELKKISGGRRLVSVSQPSRNDSWTFAKGTLPNSDSEAEQEKVLIESISEAVGASVTEGGFFKRNPFVRDIMDMYVSGFDEELKARVPELNITSSARLSLADQPVAFILTALNDLNYLDVQVAKSDSQDQKVYSLRGADSLNLVTVCAESVAANRWGDRSPIQWLVPNGKIRPNNSSRLIDSLVKYGILDLKAFNGNKEKAVKEISKSVLAYIGDPKNSTMTIGHAMNDGRRAVLKALPPLPTATSDTALLEKFEAYLRGRGISQSVIDVAKSQNIIYPSIDGDHREAVSMVAFDGFGDVMKPIVQRFVPSSDGKWTKMFVKSAPTSGTAHIVKAKDEKYIVLGEANIDMYAFLSAIELAGGDKSMYSAYSLMSATNVPSWFENSFSLLLPKDKDDGDGYLVDKTYEVRDKSELSENLSRFFGSAESVKFVDDGRPSSKAALNFFNKVMEFSGVPSNKISVVYSENRMTEVPSDNQMVFDRTCIERTMEAAGVSLNDDGELVYTHEHVVYTEIVTDEHKAEAKRRVMEKSGDSKFILAFDNDLAGHSKSASLYKFFKLVGVPCNPVVVPFESKSDMEFASDLVVDIALKELAPLSFEFNEFLLLNDMNDFLKKMQGADNERHRLIKEFGDQVKGTVDGDKLVDDTLKVAKALAQQKSLMESTYSHIFNAAKSLGEHRKKYGLASRKGREAVKLWEKDKAEKVSTLKALISDQRIPEFHRRYLSMTKKIQDHLSEPKPRGNGFARKLSDEAFNQVRDLAKQLTEHNPKFKDAKNNPESKAEWASKKEQLVSDIKIAYKSLNDRAKQNIQKNKTVVKALAIIEKSNSYGQNQSNHNHSSSHNPSSMGNRV
ncbi:hypothetical protein [Vibrio hepatarius]|uniref:hypothetical protein n=1 Tax=Vibrio hepatarius TaxID=171383 RepID=UPI001C0A51F4|nr:hypothetical protein [Vibrio hepatarius]MBU2895939.1 hypothetical protein [Vibrio hepatarius]